MIFELGYFVGKLGRGRACLLRKGAVEIPSDLYGVIYTDMDSGWKLKLVKELKAAQIPFDQATSRTHKPTRRLHRPRSLVAAAQPDQGFTIIEKFETHAKQVGFAVVLLTPDDLGGPASANEGRRHEDRSKVIWKGNQATRMSSPFVRIKIQLEALTSATASISDCLIIT